MLIMPPGHGAVRHMSRREKWLVGGVLGAVAVLAVVLVISFSSGGPSSSHGCIYATVPGPVGAEQIHQCGDTARATCQSVNVAYSAQAARTIAAECRRAGLPIGSQ